MTQLSDLTVQVSATTHSEQAPTGLAAVLCCDWANLTETGKHNLVGVFRRLIVEEIPRRSPAFFTFIRIYGLLPAVVRAQFLDPNGENVGTVIFRGEPAPEGEEGIVEMMGRGRINLTAAGLYWLEIQADGKPLGRTPIVVEVEPREEEGATNDD